MGSGGRSGSGYEYRPALDGIRAVAVAAVLLFHGAAFLPGGFLGVDAFFVLSGFLITSLLLAERGNDGRIRLAAFWGRRARRLLPALLVVLAVTVVGARYLLPADDPLRLRWDALSALSYVANWRMIYQGGGYFDQTAPPSALQHTWTLGIEEQFYLLWPLLLLVIPRRFLVAACCAGAVASATLMAVLYHPFDLDRAYFGTDTRAQALLVGCALAAARPLSRRVAAVAAALGGTVFLAALVLANGSDGWLYRGGFLGVALAVAGVIAHSSASPQAFTARVLALPALVWLGRISYGVYLWHWPLYQFLSGDRTGLAGVNLLGLRVGVTLAVAAASYVLIEQPIRRGVVLPRRVMPAATATAMAGVATVVVVMTPASHLPSPAVAFSAPAPGPAASNQRGSPMQRPGRRPGKLPRVTFFGDSVSWTLGTYWPQTPDLDVSVQALQGCGIATLPDIMQLGTPHTNLPGCERWEARWRAGVNKEDPDVAVILLDRWELMDRKLNGRWTHVGEPDYDAYLGGLLRTGISTVGGRGARVALLTAPYTHRSERPDGGLYSEDQPSRVDAWNALLHKVAAAMPDPPAVIDLNRRVCPDGRFTWSINGMRVRSDGLHFTPDAVQRWIAPWLAPQLASLSEQG
jgi:peptidoglycan/LPS O-acetylase OafA/YrhL